MLHVTQPQWHFGILIQVSMTPLLMGLGPSSAQDVAWPLGATTAAPIWGNTSLNRHFPTWYPEGSMFSDSLFKCIYTVIFWGSRGSGSYPQGTSTFVPGQGLRFLLNGTKLSNSYSPCGGLNEMLSGNFMYLSTSSVGGTV